MEHLDENQRYFIFKSLQANRSKSEIAKLLGVDRSTVYREIRRNSVKGEYRSETAELLAMARRREGHRHCKYGQQVWDEACAMLRQDFSPEQACGRLRRLGRPAPSVERIYQYVWERKLGGKNAEELADAAVAALRPLKKLGVLHMITSDNGKEFACHEKIARELEVVFFFARPYRSCDRGANENMNGLVRQYLPKGTDFGNVTPEDVRRIEEKLNNRPRKRLDYMTPKEYILYKFNILLR